MSIKSFQMGENIRSSLALELPTLDRFCHLFKCKRVSSMECLCEKEIRTHQDQRSGESIEKIVVGSAEVKAECHHSLGKHFEAPRLLYFFLRLWQSPQCMTEKDSACEQIQSTQGSPSTYATTVPLEYPFLFPGLAKFISI